MTGSVRNRPKSGRIQSATDEEHALDVLQTFIEDPHTSLRKAAQQHDMHPMSETHRSSSILKRSSTTDLTSQQKETVKAKLAKLKQARVERGARLHGIYRVVIEMVAFYLDEESTFVEEGILDSEQHLVIMDNFFASGGPQAIIFNCAKRLAPPPECGRFFYGLPKDALMRRVIVSDCSDIDLSGTSILVYRISENRNSSEDLMYAVFQVDGENTSIISYVYFLHDLVTKPQLGRTTAWGDMNRTIKGPENKKNFLDDFSGYVNFLKMTKTDLDGAVKFETDKKLYDILKEPDKLMKQVTNINVISWAETIVRSWMKKMEWVLTQSEQLRSERPDVAPEAELEHWCRLLAMFASIVEHGRTPECVTYITFLIQARSKVIKKWKFFDNWVTFSENEASDNVKYLYALQRYLEPLYRMSPETMTSYLPSLLYAIRMTYAMSRFLNTAERITTLLVKKKYQFKQSPGPRGGHTSERYLPFVNPETHWVNSNFFMLFKLFIKVTSMKKLGICKK
ncbi:hypothetical protein J6590_013740 [Homalodisca vitripennis]|nr:hypothetical protein J6590_013740 [Homalodisca vitripennis]